MAVSKNKSRALLTTVLALTGTLMAAGVWSRTRQTAAVSNAKSKNCNTADLGQWYVKIKTGGCKNADSKASLVFGAFDDKGVMRALRPDDKDCDDQERGYEGYYAFGLNGDQFIKDLYVCGCSKDSWFGQPLTLGSSKSVQNPIYFDLSRHDCSGRGWTFSSQSKDSHAGSSAKKCRQFQVYRTSSNSVTKGWRAKMVKEFDDYPHGLNNYC